MEGGLIFGGAILRKVFWVTSLGGLYLEGLIHGGAYFRNFTVYLTIIPRARMGSESIAAEWAIDSEAMRARGIIVLVKSN